MKPNFIASSLQLALMLELSITPKPGLIDRRTYNGTYEQYLATISILYPYFYEAASNKNKPLGSIIEAACLKMLNSQHGGNTHLGTILLLIPIARAAANTKQYKKLNKSLKNTILTMNHEDTTRIFQAIRTIKPGGLKRVAYLDVTKEKTYKRIQKEKIGVIEALKPYVEYDVVAHEYITGYSLTTAGYEFLKKEINVQRRNINDAGVVTFLKLLSVKPDFSIARRFGITYAKHISRLASKILLHGCLETSRGRKLLFELDSRLRKQGVKPSSTVDVLAASISMLTLLGWKP